MFDFLKRPSRRPTDEVDPSEARRRQLAGALLIDVREPEEWADGHVPGARHIPLGRLPRRLADLPRDREVLFICRSGNRSSAATAAARQGGIANAMNVRGGMRSWVQTGLPVERGS